MKLRDIVAQAQNQVQTSLLEELKRGRPSVFPFRSFPWNVEVFNDHIRKLPGGQPCAIIGIYGDMESAMIRYINGGMILKVNAAGIAPLHVTGSAVFCTLCDDLDPGVCGKAICEGNVFPCIASIDRDNVDLSKPLFLRYDAQAAALACTNDCVSGYRVHFYLEDESVDVLLCLVRAESRLMLAQQSREDKPGNELDDLDDFHLPDPVQNLNTHVNAYAFTVMATSASLSIQRKSELIGEGWCDDQIAKLGWHGMTVFADYIGVDDPGGVSSDLVAIMTGDQSDTDKKELLSYDKFERGNLQSGGDLSPPEVFGPIRPVSTPDKTAYVSYRKDAVTNFHFSDFFILSTGCYGTYKSRRAREGEIGSNTHVFPTTAVVDFRGVLWEDSDNNKGHFIKLKLGDYLDVNAELQNIPYTPGGAARNACTELQVDWKGMTIACGSSAAVEGCKGIFFSNKFKLTNGVVHLDIPMTASETFDFVVDATCNGNGGLILTKQTIQFYSWDVTSG